MALQTLELLAAHFAQWACSAAFPEMMHLPLQQLRRFAKQCKVERFRSSAKALAAALEANIAYVAAQRASDTFAPKDTASVLRFLASDDASQKVRSLTLHFMYHFTYAYFRVSIMVLQLMPTLDSHRLAEMKGKI